MKLYPPLIYFNLSETLCLHDILYFYETLPPTDILDFIETLSTFDILVSDETLLLFSTPFNLFIGSTYLASMKL